MTLQDLVQLGHELESINDKASNLWSWLPSHAEAVKHHGDYACEQRRGHDDVMQEACRVFSVLAGYDMPLVEVIEWFSCPCGEHDLTEEEAAEMLKNVKAGKGLTDSR
jgi:hypothetical protein